MADGVSIIRSLLVADAALTAVVPDTSIVAGILPEGATLGAVAITRVSGNDRNIPFPGVNRRVTERVQVSAFAKTYPQTKQMLRLIKHAAADKIGSIAGATEVTVRTDSAGPDFMDDSAFIHIGSQDFIVSYTEMR